MKTRVLFGVFGFLFVLLALYVFPPIVLEVIVAVLCLMATYELLSSARLVHNRLLMMLCMLVSFGIAAGHSSLVPWDWRDVTTLLVYVLLLGSFMIELRFHANMQVRQVAWSFFGAILVPGMLLSLLRIFQMEQHHGPVIVLLPLLAAWGADTCALFAGILFGKRPLAPVVSPKKTVEGAAGGIIGGTVLVLFAVLLMNQFLEHLELPLWLALVLGATGAILGELGDLSFSVIKRQAHIKDYGSVFPGHGGVLDRFDSVLFVAPFAEIIFRLMWKI